ncbi:MAG: TonB-dependent receptor [Acidobacteria bacterium]|nr:TonB-dependent receptor [Acidobacteriota bacterium]
MKSFSTAIRLLGLFSLAATLVWGQSSYTASVRGNVTDASRAAVVGAHVVLTEADRNVPRSVVTDEAGRYFLTALPPGRYTLSVEAPGFRKYTQTNIALVVQQQATIDVSLSVGDLTTTVEVESSGSLLNTTISTMGQVVENRYMVTLPNIGRNPLYMLNLTPGVVGVNGSINPTNTNFVANGARNATSDVLVDGAIVNTTEQNSGVTDLKWTPSVDAVQEFKMQTNFFGAEYAQSGGAIINLITKSGTNAFHGSAYEFYRDSNLNANSWSNNRTGTPKTYYQRHQAGGVLGGPIKRNKTFFFVSYEITKSKNPGANSATFPTLEQRDGDFSKTFFSDGRLITVYNPFDMQRDASNAVKRNPFPGNIIPKSMIDPVSLKALAYFPKPNALPTNPITNVNNFYGQVINPSKNQQSDFKVDHTLTEKLRFTARYSFGRSSNSPNSVFAATDPNIAVADPWNGPSYHRPQNASGNLTYMQNPTTVWVASYGMIYADFGRVPFIETFDVTTLGLPKYMQDAAEYHVFPMFSPGGFTNVGNQGWWRMDRQEGVHQFSGSMTKTKGGHTIKAGAERRHNWLDYAQPGYPSGNFTFDAGVTRQDPNIGNSYQGNGFASMLLGWGSGSNFHLDPKVFNRAGYWGFFVQDDWKVTRKLTVNLGLRYEFDMPRWERYNRFSYWDLDAPAPINVPGYKTNGVYRFVDDKTKSPFDSDRSNFGPRLGFAYALNNKTSIRSGVGIFYSLSRATASGHTGSAFNTNSGVFWSLDSGATRNATLSNPYPNGFAIPPGASLGDKTFLGRGAGTVLRDTAKNPEMYSWNFSIQREVGLDSLLEINYTGSRSPHLYSPYGSLSPLDPVYWLGPNAMTRNQLQAQVPNPFYGIITDPLAANMNGRTIQQYRLFRNMPQFDGASGTEPNRADATYQALQVKWEKRFSRGLAVVSHYTWSKTLDDVSVTSGNLTWLGGTTALQNPLNFALEKSLSSNDVAHRFVASADYQVPIGRGRRYASNSNRVLNAFIGGWEASMFLTLQSGPPLQPNLSGGNLWNGTQRPNLLSDPVTTGSIYDRMNNYINADAFSRPAVDTFGTAPRYLNMRGPKINTWDAALLKDFHVTERQRLQFRLEATNFRNHPVFGNPDTTYGGSNFGRITGTKVGSRNAQISLKYIF